MASLSPDDVTALLKAATDAAKAATDAVAALRDAQAARTSSSSGFHEASKVVRQPEPFGSESHDDDLSKWQDFTINFKAWLYYGNPKFELDLHRVEVTHADTPIGSVEGEPQDVKDRCAQLYSILTGLLRGKPLRLLRQVENRNGFETWRQLTQLYLPKTKSRAISLLAALMNAPNFTMKDRTLLDQVLGLERIRAEYVRSSSTDISDDLMLSVLVKCLPKAIQQHVQLQLNESSTYSQVRNLVVGYERTTTTWSPGKIHSELGILPSSSSSVGNPSASYSGPAPMEIDRFEKGKNKGKVKGKTKGKDGPKGKGKSKSDKGKGGKSGKGPMRTATASDQCLYCGKYGHFKRDCRKFLNDTKTNSVNQVENTANSSAPPSSAASTAPSATSAAASSVRLFTGFQSTSGPIIEDLDDDVEVRDLTMYDSAGSCNMVSQFPSCMPADNILDTCASDNSQYAASCEQFDMTCTDDDGLWTICDEAECFSDNEPNAVYDNLDAHSIRTVGFSDPREMEVVLDSGADGSVLPLEFGAVGYPDKSFDGSKFIDAQGKPINVKGARIAEVRFGQVVFKERFIIAAVTAPLISMGRLLKDGWLLQNNADGTMALVRNSKSIPVHFKRNSLCASGVIRMLSTSDSTSPTHSGQCSPVEHVRALTLGRALTSLGAGWVKLGDSMYAIRSQGTQHMDTTLCPSDGLLWLRTTLVQLPNGTWELDEFCTSISDLRTMTGPFEANKNVVESITIAHTTMVPPEALGFYLHDDDVVIAPRSGIPLRSSPPVARSDNPPEMDDVPADQEGEAPVPERGPDIEDTEVIVDGVKLDTNSPLKILHDACASLGLHATGSKKKCLKRLWDYLQAQELIAAHGAQQQLRGETTRTANPQFVPEQPTQKQIDEHNLTHHPFAAWCELCIANRSQQDPHPVQHDEGSSAHSTVSFDFGFASRNDQDPKACGLFIHDRQTGAMHVVPTPQKGGRHLQYLCTEFCRFLVWLGYTTVGLRCDQEPSTLSLLEAVKKTCRGLGIRIMDETVAPGSHASNGAAEVTVKVLRRHANLLIQQIEQGVGIPEVIGCHHPLYQWSLLHAAWLHNRFVVRHGKTAYELCTSRQYTGRIALFGERILGFLKLSTKGSPTWTKGIWLGKTMNNDVHIIAIPGHPQLFVTRSVRRLSTPWDMEMIGGMEVCPWQFGYASLGSQLVLAKRISAPPVLSLPPARPIDVDAEAVKNVPPTPDEGALAPPSPRMVGPPSTAVPVMTGDALDESMEVLAEAGNLPYQVGLGAPVTPVESSPMTPVEQAAPSSSASVSGPGDVSTSGSRPTATHGRDESGEGASEPPSKHQRVLAVFEHEDETHPTFFQEDEIDGLESYDYSLEDESDEDMHEFSQQSGTSSDDVLKQLSVPYSTFEPDLPADELLKLDMLADELEIKRLKDMGVLIPAETYEFGGEVPKRLTTRMVRTWRDKFINGIHVWLRRSRYVAREFAWLSPDRQDLFSPASSVLTVRLLPALFMKWKDQDYILSAIDIADAFLMVPQKELTVVSCELAAGDVFQFVLGRVLPGQRNGSQLWHESFSAFLKDELQICEFPAYPSLLKSKGDECVLLLHVDDVLCLCRRNYLDETLMPSLKAKYKVACETLCKAGDELTFLKRRHVMVTDDEMAIQSHPKHLERLFDLLAINRKLQPKRTPGHPLLDEPDNSTKLGPADASVYRSCVGVLLYISSDYVECQYTIRGLSQSMSSPTTQSMMCLRHLAQYLLGCTEHAMVLRYEAHQGLLHYNPCDYTLEIYSDRLGKAQAVSKICIVRLPLPVWMPALCNFEIPACLSTEFSRSRDLCCNFRHFRCCSSLSLHMLLSW